MTGVQTCALPIYRLKEWNLGLGMTDYSELRDKLKLDKQKEDIHEP